MKLIQAEIFDFKSIKHDTIDVRTNQLCLVGKNECGKSSIIEAINCLNFLGVSFRRNQVNKDSSRYPNGFPVVSGVFELQKNSYKALSELLAKYLLSEQFASLPKNPDKCFLQLKRWGNGISNISIDLTDKTGFAIQVLSNIKEKAKFLDDFVETVYPVIEYYENEELLIEPATVQELMGPDRKFETFRRLLAIGGCSDLSVLASDDYNFLATYQARLEDKINLILKKHYRQDNSLSISINTIRHDKLNIVIRDSSKQTFSIDERSPGFRYYFSFLINKLWAKQEHNAKNFILLLDEPGRNLHPNGAKDLLKTLDDISERSQIFFTTHNPFLTIRNDIDSLVFVDKSPTDGTKANRKPYLNKYQILRKELGILLNDTFLIGDINLIVEGSTEKLAFHRLFQHEKYRDLEWMNIYDAGGVTNISQALNYIGPRNLDLAGIAFLDSDKPGRRELEKSGFKTAMKEKKWTYLQVNHAFNDTKERTFEDLFPQELYVSAFNAYCDLNKEVFERPYESYVYTKPIETPIIDKLEEHYKSFIEEDKRPDSSITKQTVISILFDNIESMKEKEQNSALEILFKIADSLKSKFREVEKYAGQ